MSDINYCVVLANLGAPSNLDEVYPFLKNLFSDKDIIKFPFGKIGQKFFSWLIATTRAPKSRGYYRAIGGGSPLQANTEALAKNLLMRLGQKKNFQIFIFQRYWNPFANDVIKEIKKKKFTRYIIIPLYPHYSTTTTLSSIKEWKRYSYSLPKPVFIESFYKRDDYISCCVDQINKKLSAFKTDPHILFSAHSIPEKRVLDGDPYKTEIEDNVKMIMQSLPKGLSFSLCFQSKVGPVKWLEPSVETEIDRLVAKKVKNLLVFPISFVSENLETLYELDIQKKEYALNNGIAQFERAGTVQGADSFVDVLFNLVMENRK